MDYVGMTTATFEAITHAKRSYAQLAAVTNAGDPNLTTLNNILLSLS
jgi:D-arabinose 5-phosphate isomerase GutQ